MMKKTIAVTLAFLLVLLSVPVMTASAAQPAADVVARFVLESANSTDRQYGRGTTNSDGSRTGSEDNSLLYGMEAALPVGVYYAKFFVKVHRGAGPWEGMPISFFEHVNVSGGGTPVINDLPKLATFKDDEWQQVIIQFRVLLEHHNVRRQYRINGPVGGALGADGTLTVGREIVISTNGTPLSDPDVAAAFDVTPGTSQGAGTYNVNDGSRTATSSAPMIFGLKATLPAGSYYAKFLTKISSRADMASNLAPISQFESTNGVGGDVTSVALPAVGTYVSGQWKSVVVPFTVTSAQGDTERTYRILGPQNGAADLTVAKNIVISRNAAPLPLPQSAPDYTLTAFNLYRKYGGSTDYGSSYNPVPDTLDIKSNAAAGYIASGISAVVSVNPFVNSGDVPKGKFYVKVVAKVPATASSATRNSTLFNIELQGKSTKNVTLGEFTAANTYQTVVREFDASSFSHKDKITLNLKFFPGVSNLTVKSVTVSATPDAVGAVSDGTGLQWPADQAFPSFSAPAGTLTAIDVRPYAIPERRIATALQGLVNKTQPRILVMESREEDQFGPLGEKLWPTTLGLQYTMIAGTQSSNTSIKNLVQQYLGEVKGVVVYDRNQPHAINVAASVASLYDALPIPGNLLSTFTSAPFNLAVVKDLRPGAADIAGYDMGTPSGGTGAYDYLFDKYKTQLSQRLIIGLNPNPIPNEGGHFSLLDLAYATKAAVVWLDPNDRAGLTADRDTLNKMTDLIGNHDTCNTYFAGWWPEEEHGIAYGTKKGMPTVPSDNFENYSIYSAMSREITTPVVPKKPELENGKVYIAVNMSDGDNAMYMQHALHWNFRWQVDDRRQYPINWTITPALLDFAPQILNFYYQSAGANSFTAGPNGLGYTREANWRNNDWIHNYAKVTNDYFEKTGLNSVTIWGTVLNDNSFNGQLYNAFTDRQYFPSLLGMFSLVPQNNSHLVWSNSGVPYQHFDLGKYTNYPDDKEEGGWVFKGDKEYAKIKALQADPDRPVFGTVEFKTWDVRSQDVIDVIDRLNAEHPDKYVFVRDDHYFMLLNEANGKPINRALQAKTSASGSDEGYEAGKAVDGSIGRLAGWQSSKAGDKWLTVDFGQRVDISRYVLKNASAGYQPEANNTRDFKLQVSADGVEWTDIDSVAGNTQGFLYRDASAANVRYARVYITNPGADGVARIQDLEIYGVPSVGGVDKTKLSALIAQAGGLDNASHQYDDALWTAMAGKLTAAQTLNSDGAVTQTQVDDAYLALYEAVNALTVDKSVLKSAVAAADTKSEKAYTPESWAALQVKLAAAVDVFTNALATPAVVAQAAQELTAAISALEERTYTKGDVNDDGNITAYDALLALQIATRKITPTPDQQLAADVNNDGSVTAYDALLILQYATKKITAFPKQ